MSTTTKYQGNTGHTTAQDSTCQIEPELLRKSLTTEMSVLLDMFERHNHAIRVAGGAVRDLLLGRLPHDFDFATTATPDEMRHMFEAERVRMLNKNGERHGTVTVRLNDCANFEVTTLRIDRVTDGRHVRDVEFTRDWRLDASRRDLTINSMFLDLRSGHITDYFDGREDLRVRRVRFVGDPDLRIREDYLRILRYFRFFGRFAPSSDSHEQRTLASVCDNMHGLAVISGERIWMELRQILMGRFGVQLWRTMLECGIARYLGIVNTTIGADNSKRTAKCSGAKNTKVSRVTSKSLLGSQDVVATSGTHEQHCAEGGYILSEDIRRRMAILEQCMVDNQSILHSAELSPVTVLCSSLSNAGQFLNVHARLKLSSIERDLGLFLADNMFECSEVENNNITARSPIVNYEQIVKGFEDDVLPISQSSSDHTSPQWPNPEHASIMANSDGCHDNQLSPENAHKHPYSHITLDYLLKRWAALHKNTHLSINQLCYLIGRCDLAARFDARVTEIGDFSVRGKHVVEAGVRPGKNVSEIMQALRCIWTESNFTLSHAHLIACIPRVAEALNVKLHAPSP